MHLVKRIFVINIICLLLISSNELLHIFAQTIEPLSAVVTAERDFLRDRPSTNANSKSIVVKGTKLKVVQSNNVKGWYLVYSEETPSIFGYIYGNSIKFVKPQKLTVPKNQAILNKQNTGLLPKDIILDKSPTIDTDQSQAQLQVIKDKLSNNKSNKFAARSNYCQSSLFCPDVDEVQVALFENSDKFQKGKFEKTVDWEKRKSTLLSEIKLKDGRTAAEKMYFLYEEGTASLIYNEPQYDADKEKWTFDLHFLETNTQTCLPIISQGSADIFCLIVPKKLGTELKAFVSMQPVVAQTNDKNLQIAFVGKIVEPYIWLNDNSPIRDIRSGIHFELEEVTCLNPKTGQRWKVDGFEGIIDLTMTLTNKRNEIVSSKGDDLPKFEQTVVTNPMNAESIFGYQ